MTQLERNALYIDAHATWRQAEASLAHAANCGAPTERLKVLRDEAKAAWCTMSELE